MEEAIRKCLQQIVPGGNPLREDTDLLTSGVNSINFIRLIVLLEDEFNIEIADEDIELRSFRTILEIREVLEKYT